MKTIEHKTDWKQSLAKYQHIARWVHARTQANRARKMKLARQLLCKVQLGANGFLEVHNWGTSLPGERGMLCQRALKLANDWSAIESGNRVTAMAWNKYMVPAGACRSVVPTYAVKRQLISAGLQASQV